MASNLKPNPNRTVFITKRGATVSATVAASSNLPVHDSGSFVNGDRLCLADDDTVITAVNGTPTATVVPVNPPISVAAGDRLVNLAADGGVGQPDYRGYEGAEFVYTDPAASTVATGNKVTTNAEGEWVAYVASGRSYDEHHLDGNGRLSANSETLRDRFAPGLEKVSDLKDGASSVGHILDTLISFVTAGAKLLSLRNAGVEKFSVDKDGDILATDLSVAAGTFSGAVTIQGAATLQSTLAVTGLATLTAGLRNPAGVYDSTVDPTAPGTQTAHDFNTPGTTWTGGENLFRVRNNGSARLTLDSEGRMTIASTGSTGLSVATKIISTGGDIEAGLAGKGLVIKEGSNARMGTATLDGGSPSQVTVNTTAVGASSRIFLMPYGVGLGSAPGAVAVASRVAGTSFTIVGPNASIATVAWFIVEPS